MNNTDQKNLGAYYTPTIISEFLTKKLNIKKEDSVLEPSVGDGSFLFNALKYTKNITAVDIDQEAIDKLKEEIYNLIGPNQNINIFCTDFLTFSQNNSENKFDIILSNPPYLSFKKLPENQREELENILQRNHIKTKKQTNLWAGFITSSLNLLKNSGKFAFVLPSEFLYSVYGKEVQEFLLKNSQKLTIIGFKNLVFDGIQQDTILVYGEKKSSLPDKLNLNCFELDELKDLINFENINELESKNSKIVENPKLINWKLANSSLKFQKIYDKFMQESKPLTDLAGIKIGLTTGANNIFIINQDIEGQYKLCNYTKPLLRSAKDVKSTSYSNEIFKDLRSKNKKVLLIDFNNKDLNENAKKYVKYFENLNKHSGYKLQNRDKWYKIPSLDPPDMFMLRRVGEDARIIDNKIGAMSTDNFHHIFLKDGHTQDELIVLSYSSVYRLSIELASRSYGGGALEVLSGDFNKLRVPKTISTPDYKRIRKNIDGWLKDDLSIYDIVKNVDSELSEHINISKNNLKIMYEEWASICKSRNNKKA